MKLSVLAPDVALSMIPEISRYANTQNKVSEADLFANHPFNRRVEEIARQIWAPSRTGSRQMTHWFYERARAQYQTEQIKLTPAQRKAFLLQNPLNQAQSEIIATYVYKTGLLNADFSMATAIGLFNSVVNLFLLLGVNFAAKRITGNGLWS